MNSYDKRSEARDRINDAVARYNAASAAKRAAASGDDEVAKAAAYEEFERAWKAMQNAEDAFIAADDYLRECSE